MAPPNPTKVTELGLERLCRGCGEFWPVDDTFWYFQGGKVMGRCRACWHERQRVGNRTKFAPLIATLALLLGMLAFPAIVSAEAVPQYCASENPRVTLYENSNGTGDWLTVCHNISNYDLITHSQAGDCIRQGFDPFGNDWNNCASSIRLTLPNGWCFRAYNFTDYAAAFETWKGPMTTQLITPGSAKPFDSDIMSSSRFFADPNDSTPGNCV